MGTFSINEGVVIRGRTALSWHIVSRAFAPCKGIRIPESRNFLLVESGILGFGIRNPALGIRNPTKDWNPESKLPKDVLQIGLSYSLERKAIYGKPPQSICLNVMTYSVILAYLVSKPYFTSSIWKVNVTVSEVTLAHERLAGSQNSEVFEGIQRSLFKV